MRRPIIVTLTLLTASTYTGCSQESASEPQRMPLPERLDLNSNQMYTALIAESMLQPNEVFSRGLYRNRTNGCCSPRHLGTDFLGTAGEAVHALLPGVILPSPISGPHCQFGYVVVVWTKFTDGTEAVVTYGHLSGRVDLRPKLSGNVTGDEIIGYIGHTGGTSPAGSRCGTDDENGDGSEHVHVGMRLGSPPRDANGHLIWAYYGYQTSSEDVDTDTNGAPHYGRFTDVVKIANCRGTQAGLYGAREWLPEISSGIAGGYCRLGGLSNLGPSRDDGKGDRLADWGETYCQGFSGGVTSASALCWNQSAQKSYWSFEPIWQALKIETLFTELGSPVEDTWLNGTELYQTFERGRIQTQGAQTIVYVNGQSPVITLDGRVVNDDVSSATASSSTGRSSSVGASSSSTIATSLGSSATSGPTQYSSSHAESSSTNSSPDSTLCQRVAPNLVANGEFGLPPRNCGWYLEDHYANRASAQQLCEFGHCFADLWTTQAGEVFFAQLEQLVHIQSGRHYRLSFSAKSDYPTSFQMQLMKQSEPWTNYGAFDWFLTSNVDWTDFTYEFDSYFDDPTARLTFMFGSRSEHLYLDHVRLEPISGQ